MIRSVFADGVGLRFSCVEHKVEAGAAFLYVLRDSEHSSPFGLITGFQVPIGRSSDIGERLLKAMLQEAKKRECYKVMLIVPFGATDFQAWCKRQGAKQVGLEFRFLPPLAPDEEK